MPISHIDMFITHIYLCISLSGGEEDFYGILTNTSPITEYNDIYIRFNQNSSSVIFSRQTVGIFIGSDGSFSPYL